jgi:phosphatidate cytidylyltransferase
VTVLRDSELLSLIVGVLVLLVASSIIGWLLSRRTMTAAARATVENINARVRAWWVMAALFVASVSTGAGGSILLFSLISFLALREFVTLAPTRLGDHRALFWSFFVVTPI